MKQKKLTKLVLNKETIVTLERSDMKDVVGGAERIPLNEKSIWGCWVSLNMGMCIQE